MKTQINCLNCEKEYLVYKKELKRGFGKFCSRKCAGEYNGKRRIITTTNVTCALCSKPFHLSDSKRKNSKSGLYFCSRRHKDMAQRIGGVEEIMPAHYGNGNNADYRSLIFSVRPKICERCGFDKHQAAIVVHHKDRNRSNNDITNLEVLCANCHYIEHWNITKLLASQVV